MSDTAQTMASGHRMLIDDLNGSRFPVGVDRGYWRLIDLAWPTATFGVAAATRAGAPEEYAVRLELSTYPQAPAGRLWDVERDQPLDIAQWPTGGRASQAFNPGWRPDAIYLPVDRIALEGHDPWITQHPEFVWDRSRDVSQYLQLIHEILNEDGYAGTRG
jgi:hypothetical protein